MCRANHHRNPLFCIIPPNVLENIAQNGTPEQRAEALNTLAIDNTVRVLRAAQPRRRGITRRSLMAEPVKHRDIYDAGNTTELPGRLVRSEGAPASSDVVVNEAYDGLGQVWDFYQTVFERNSIDDDGLPLVGVVHFGRDFDNAFWNSREMVFGDGKIFGRFTASLDVIGHELSHGVTEHEAGLAYFMQSGALNESMSDVFGVMVKQKLLNQTAAAANWLIGEELFKGRTLQGVALRSMKAPGTAFDDPLLGKDPQPAHMKNYVRTFKDNGGVHINSGIPNHAFYLVATALGGFAWDKAGRIWYETLRDPQIKPLTGFTRFARRTLAQAGMMFGPESVESKAVKDAWNQVGIKV